MMRTGYCVSAGIDPEQAQRRAIRVYLQQTKDDVIRFDIGE